MKDMNRLLISSILTLMLCTALMLGTTFAWFTDSVENRGNIIKAADEFNNNSSQLSDAGGYAADTGIEAANEAELIKALEDAGNGKTVITLADDIALGDTLTIRKGSDITIQLNGRTLSRAEGSTADSLIVNYGKVTLADSGEGKITMEYAGEDNACLIRNEGEFSMAGGKVEITENGEAPAASAAETSDADKKNEQTVTRTVAAVYSTCAADEEVRITITDGAIDGGENAGMIIDCSNGSSVFGMSGGEITGGSKGGGLIVIDDGHADGEQNIDISGGTIKAYNAPALTVVNMNEREDSCMNISASGDARLVRITGEGQEEEEPQAVIFELAGESNTIRNIAEGCIVYGTEDKDE